MPTAADELKSGASDEATSAAISKCIEQMSGEHPDWENDRVAAACHSMARKAKGESEPGIRQKKSSRVGG